MAKKVIHSTCAKDGGADQLSYRMPPPSEEYRANFDDIFRKKAPEEAPPTVAEEEPSC